MEYNIIVPYDFSQASTVALKTAVELHERLRVKLHLIHVLSEEFSESEQTKAENALRLAIHRNASKCEVSYAVLNGKTGSQILQYAANIKNPVIFLSKSLEDESVAYYTGPIVHYIVANASCPVLVLKRELDIKKINTILVPMDLNHENKLKLGYAIFLSRLFGNAMIRILSVVYDVDDYSINKLMFRMNHLDTFFEKMGISSVGEIIRCAEEDGEHYSKVSVEYAEKSDAELILLMTHDERTGQNEGVSQEADYMLSHFKNSVLSITPFVKN